MMSTSQERQSSKGRTPDKRPKPGQMMSTSQERQSSKGRIPNKHPWPKPEVWDLK